MNDRVHPLRALWVRHRRHRRRAIAATTGTVINKVADVMPELLIGAAVDVVVRGSDSFVANLLGVQNRFAQIALGGAYADLWSVQTGAPLDAV